MESNPARAVTIRNREQGSGIRDQEEHTWMRIIKNGQSPGANTMPSTFSGSSVLKPLELLLLLVLNVF